MPAPRPMPQPGTPHTPAASSPSAASPRVAAAGRRRWYRQLYPWVLLGIAAGIVVGTFAPGVGVDLQPLGTTFVDAIKMIIAPIVFCVVVGGIAQIDDIRRVGRVGLKTLGYFEVLTTVALALGLVVMNVFRPGDGVHANAAELKVSTTVAGYISQGQEQGWGHFLSDLVPSSVVGAFAEGNVLQVLFFAVLFGIALKLVGSAAAPIGVAVERLGKVVFQVLRIVMYAAPVGAFGAMAYTIGKYGLHTLTSLGQLIAIFYGTSLFFVLVVLGGIAKACGINMFKLLRYLRAELLVVLGTSSSESVLPQVMRKLEAAGAPRQIVGLTVPTGYSFNLDGTCIYLTLASLYVAQALDVHLSLGQQLGIIAVLLLTSKGAAGVTGSGFIVLAATLSTVGTIPVAGIMLLFGIDKFMSECRALTNVCGNSLATLVVAHWEGVLDREKLRRALAGEPVDGEFVDEPAKGVGHPAERPVPVAAGHALPVGGAG
ncbi:C4-dicarboxylate transporter DctA [Pseudofrankia saprophytica]|uniref:C4-dicarboxylate transporter DctA n=1 Tax=Pseudofrankia saprophytica TaxID=298655 RepID=UPI000234B648|nr:C4-dicarboxylate transporter DctA [Pseudofrankia saprophytica]